MAITKKADYEQTVAHGEGFPSLPKGGYVCRILRIEETKSKTGRDMIHIAFDITEGEFQNHFTELFKRRKDKATDPLNVKFPFEGQMWIMTEDYEDPTKTSSKFKGFCSSLEDSGTKVWSDDGNFIIDNIKGASIGIVYQNQEQEYQGKTYWRAVPWGCRSVEAIREGDFFVPEDKPLPPSESIPEGFSKVQDDELPF